MGRETDLDNVLEELHGDVGVCVIHGMPGVGKTALAIAAGHVLEPHAEGRVYFIDLHGYSERRAPVSTAQALAALLSANGMSPAGIPWDRDEQLVTEARSELWRNRTSDEPILLLLDNALTSAQVTALLPEHPNCRVLITSRNRLGALEGGSYHLKSLDPDASAALLRATARRTNLGTDADIATLADRCHHLPLTIKLVARRLRHHTTWTAQHAIEDLRRNTSLITETTAEGRAVAAALESTYRALSEDLRVAYLRVSQHPATVVDPFSTAALLECETNTARSVLENLFDEHLLEEIEPRRYGMHDLLREFANARITDEDSRASLRRLAEYYAAATMAASGLTRPDLSARDSAYGPPEVPQFHGDDDARTWMTSEIASVLLCASACVHLGFTHELVQISVGSARFLEQTGPWQDALELHSAARDAAVLLGDTGVEAEVRKNLGGISQRLGDYDTALAELGKSAELFDALKDPRGQARSLMLLGSVLRRLPRRFGQAREAHLRAVDLLHREQDRFGEVHALDQLCVVHYMASEFRELETTARQALEIANEIDYAFGQAYSKSLIGLAERMFGQLDSAEHRFEDSYHTYVKIGHLQGQAETSNMLGTVLILLGRHADAREAIERALEIHRSLGNRTGVAQSMNYLGCLLLSESRAPQALPVLEEAVALQRALGHGFGMAEALNSLGRCLRQVDQVPQSFLAHRRALYLAGFIPMLFEQANAHAGLSACCVALNESEDAATHRIVADREYDRLLIGLPCRF